MTKSGWIGIRISPELKVQAEALAKADDRSMSSWVAMLIQREVEAKKKVKR